MHKANWIPILLFTFFACNETVNPSIINGKWKLIESLTDPGDGSGVYVPYEGNQIATIYSDSSVLFTEPFCFSQQGEQALEAQLYKDSIHWPACGLTYQYKYVDELLFLYPPCIEPCGLKFEKIAN